MAKSKKLQWKGHPNNPSSQPFNVTARPNLYKKAARWQQKGKPRG